MIRTLHVGTEVKIDGTKIEVKAIDPHGRWVKVHIESREHVKIEAAQSEPQTR